MADNPPCACPFCSGLMRLIHTKAHYESATARIKDLCMLDLDPGTDESEELAILLLLTEAYEDIHYPIDLATPAAAIKFRMEQAELTPAAVSELIGEPVSVVYDLIGGSVEPDLEQIRALHWKLNIPLACLIGKPSQS